MESLPYWPTYVQQRERCPGLDELRFFGAAPAPPGNPATPFTTDDRDTLLKRPSSCSILGVWSHGQEIAEEMAFHSKCLANKTNHRSNRQNKGLKNSPS
jgi:hypothetical protein